MSLLKKSGIQNPELIAAMNLPEVLYLQGKGNNEPLTLCSEIDPHLDSTANHFLYYANTEPFKIPAVDFGIDVRGRNSYGQCLLVDKARKIIVVGDVTCTGEMVESIKTALARADDLRAENIHFDCIVVGEGFDSVIGSKTIPINELTGANMVAEKTNIFRIARTLLEARTRDLTNEELVRMMPVILSEITELDNDLSNDAKSLKTKVTDYVMSISSSKDDPIFGGCAVVCTDPRNPDRVIRMENGEFASYRKNADIKMQDMLSCCVAGAVADRSLLNDLLTEIKSSKQPTKADLIAAGVILDDHTYWRFLNEVV